MHKKNQADTERKLIRASSDSDRRNRLAIALSRIREIDIRGSFVLTAELHMRAKKRRDSLT